MHKGCIELYYVWVHDLWYHENFSGPPKTEVGLLQL